MYIHKSEDAGESWRQLYFQYERSALSLAVLSPDEAFVGGGGVGLQLGGGSVWRGVGDRQVRYAPRSPDPGPGLGPGLPCHLREHLPHYDSESATSPRHNPRLGARAVAAHSTISPRRGGWRAKRGHPF